MHRLWIVAAGVVLLVSGSASAEPDIVVGTSGGVLYVDKQAATPVTGLSGTGELSVGAKVHPRSLIKARVMGFRADGNNLVVALGGELDIVGPYLGLTASAGFSLGAQSKGGNIAGFGVFARAPLTDVFAVRVESAASRIVRNDFNGIGISVVAGVEVAWRR